MLRTVHWVAGDGDFNTTNDWSPQSIPGVGDWAAIDASGAYTVTASTDETVDRLSVAVNATLMVTAGTFSILRSATSAGNIVTDSGVLVQGPLQNTGTVSGAGQWSTNGFFFYNWGTVNANSTAGLTLDIFNAVLENEGSGLIEATGAGGLTIAPRGGGYVANAGTILAANGATVTLLSCYVGMYIGGALAKGTWKASGGGTLKFASGVTNGANTYGVLRGGRWEADGGGTLAVTGGAVTLDKARIILSGAGSAFTAGDGSTFTNLQASLLGVAPIGTLELDAGAALTLKHGIPNFGMIQLAGGTLTLPRLAVAAIGHVRGFGTIADTNMPIFNGGTIEASGGTLVIASAVGPASNGLFQLDASSVLEIAADRGAANKISFVGAGGELVIDNVTQFGLNVGTSAYTGPLIENFADGDTILLKNLAPAGLTPVYNATTGILQVSNGSANVASLAFEKATLGAGSFHLAGDGHGHALLTHS